MANIVHHGARDGPGWCYWRTPAALIARYAREPAIADFLVTRSGYFPRCANNVAWRPEPLPWHETVVTLCLEGRGWIKDIHDPNAPEILIAPGEMLVVPSDTPHCYGADKKDPWSQLWFHASGARVVQFLAELGVKGAPYKGRLSNVGLVRDCLHRINELRRHGCGRPVLLEGATLGEFVLARLCAESCLQAACTSATYKPDRSAADRRQKLDSLVAFFQDNFRREISLREVASCCHVSESWLYHSFPERTGFSPMGFVIHLRLQEACRLLATSDRKLADIAACVGYDDVFYFSRLFKKHLALSPTEYRQDYSGREKVCR